MIVPVSRALLFVDLVDSTALVERLGDAPAAKVFAQFDRLARLSFAEHGGHEIDRTDGFLVLFDRPAPALASAFDIHAAAASLSLLARAAVHFGDVILRENPIEEVQRGAKPLEVDGLAKPVGARLLALALPGQTLMTPIAAELAKRAHRGGELLAEVRFLDHGAYRLKGVPDPIHLHEAGLVGRAPLRAPPGAAKGAPVGRRRPGLYLGALGALGVITVGVPAVYITRPSQPPPVPTFEERRLLSQPADQEVHGLSLKPDGSALYFIEHGQIRTLALPDGEPRTLEVDLGGRAISVDVIPPGDDLVAVVRPDGFSEYDSPVVRVSAAGPVTTLPWTARRAYVSGDGKRVFLEKQDGSWIGDLQTGRLTPMGEAGTAGWSLDDQEVAIVSMGIDSDSLRRARVDGSRAITLLQGAPILDRYSVPPIWLGADTLWVPVHRTVGDARSGGIERLLLDPDSGAVRARDVVKEWPDDKVAGLDVARGGDLWVATRATTQDEVFVVDVGSDGLPTAAPVVVTKHRRSDRPTDWLPDGRIVFTSDRSGVFDVFTQRPGEEPARLVSGPAIQSWGRVTSTGAVLSWEIVPVASPSEVQRARVVRSDPDGASPQTLLEVDIESTLRLSGRPPPGTAWLSCARNVETCALGRIEGDRYVVRLLDPTSGELGQPVHWTGVDHYLTQFELSPDGTRLATALDGKVLLVSIADHHIEELAIEGATDLQYLAWRPDGQSLYVTGWHQADRRYLCSVILVDLATGTSVPVRSAEAWRGQVTVSWDGRQVAWLDWDGSNEVFLYERTPG